MEPIISPWIIYAVAILNKVYILAVIAVMICSVMFLIAAPIGLIEDDDDARHVLKKLKWPFIVSVLVLIVTPDKQTLLTMLVAQYITPDNIQAVQGNIVEFVGQIAQAVKDVK